MRGRAIVLQLNVIRDWLRGLTIVVPFAVGSFLGRLIPVEEGTAPEWVAGVALALMPWVVGWVARVWVGLLPPAKLEDPDA